ARRGNAPCGVNCPPSAVPPPQRGGEDTPQRRADTAMATTNTASAERTEPPARMIRPRRPRGEAIVDWLTTTDHKRIGILYITSSFGFFLIGGLLAMAMRIELARPGLQLLTAEQYNQAFTLHGTIMMLMFATPLFAGFANAVMPLQIGAPDVAFPRLNALSYWLFAFGGLLVVASLLTPAGGASFGWFAYAP